MPSGRVEATLKRAWILRGVFGRGILMFFVDIFKMVRQFNWLHVSKLAASLTTLYET
jgi:hypothetical protein